MVGLQALAAQTVPPWRNGDQRGIDPTRSRTYRVANAGAERGVVLGVVGAAVVLGNLVHANAEAIGSAHGREGGIVGLVQAAVDATTWLLGKWDRYYLRQGNP